MDDAPKRQNYGGLFADDFFGPSTYLKSDVYEKDNFYYVEIDAPGLAKENIAIECQNGYLNVGITKAGGTTEEGRNYIARERDYSRFNRQFYLGNIDPDNVKAEYSEGILRITAPRLGEGSDRKTISID